MTRFKPDPAVMEKLLLAAERVDNNPRQYCCTTMTDGSVEKEVFTYLYSVNDGYDADAQGRYAGSWMSCLDEEKFCPETQQRRVMALLLTREIYRNGDHVGVAS